MEPQIERGFVRTEIHGQSHGKVRIQGDIPIKLVASAEKWKIHKFFCRLHAHIEAITIARGLLIQPSCKCAASHLAGRCAAMQFQLTCAVIDAHMRRRCSLQINGCVFIFDLAAHEHAQQHPTARQQKGQRPEQTRNRVAVRKPETHLIEQQEQTP